MIPTWLGHLLTYLFVLAFWTFIVGYFLIPIALAYWRHNERLRAEQTEKTLESLGYDTTHEHEMDAMN